MVPQSPYFNLMLGIYKGKGDFSYTFLKNVSKTFFHSRGLLDIFNIFQHVKTGHKKSLAHFIFLH